MNENLSRFKSRTLPHSYQKISSQYLHIDCIKFQPYIETHGDMDTERTVCLLNINNRFLQMHFLFILTCHKQCIGICILTLVRVLLNSFSVILVLKCCFVDHVAKKANALKIRFCPSCIITSDVLYLSL